ncbi:hypothetical protein C0993_000105 [Termitomyces sp. T159_Od127]|nr:hypothetical protein C0993_000105 [Termitomyces sp. T159_Od127]
MNSKDSYALLEISPNAGVAEIKQAYKQMALRWHPDKHHKDVNKEYANTVFAEVTNAYQTLLSDREHPPTAVGAKLRTRLPTPMPSFESLNEDCPTSAPTIDSSHLLSPSEYAASRATDNPDSLGNHWKSVMTPTSQSRPHPTQPMHESFRASLG